MNSIKLQRLPDRTPVKMSIAVSPELARALNDYSEFYGSCYAQTEPLAELIPAMLEAFLAGDRDFARMRKAKASSA